MTSNTKLNISVEACPLTPYQLGNAIMRALFHERIDSGLTARDCEQIARRMLATDDLYDALVDLVGDRGDIHGGLCVKCGRDYRGDPDLKDGDRCPSDDCPGYGAREALALADGKGG